MSGGGEPPYQTQAVFYGDSITAGVGASDAAHRFTNIVATAKGWSFTAAGINGTMLQNTVQNTVAVVGGAQANNGRDTYLTRVVQFAPTYVCILYGLNDLRLNDVAITSANFETDLGELIDLLVAQGISATNIVIGSPPYMNDYTAGTPFNGGSALKHADYVSKCAAVATAKGTKYIDVYQWMLDNGDDTLVGGDGIHPNDAGHAAIADAFLSVL